MKDPIVGRCKEDRGREDTKGGVLGFLRKIGSGEYQRRQVTTKRKRLG